MNIINNIITRTRQTLKRNVPALYTAIKDGDVTRYAIVQSKIHAAKTDQSGFVRNTEWILCLIALCAIGAAAFQALGTVQTTLRTQARVDASIQDSLHSPRHIAASILGNEKDEELHFQSFGGENRLNNIIMGLNQKSVMLRHYDVNADPDVAHLRFEVDTFLRACYESKGDSVDNERDMYLDLRIAALAVFEREPRHSALATPLLQRLSAREERTSSARETLAEEKKAEITAILRRDARFSAVTFGVGGLHMEMFESLRSTCGHAAAVTLALAMGPIASSHLNVINFAYRTIVDGARGEVATSLARFLFADSIFLLPNLIWACALVQLASLVSPAIFLVGHYVDREIFAIESSEIFQINSRIRRYKVMIAVKRACRRLRNVALGASYALIITATVGLIVSLSGMADIEPSFRHVMRLRVPHALGNYGMFVDAREGLHLIKRVFMNRAQLSTRTDEYVARLYSPGLTAFDTQEAVIIRMILSSVACVVMYMTLPPVQDNRTRDTKIKRVIASIVTFSKTCVLPTSLPNTKQESHTLHRQRRDGICSQAITFVRVTLLTVNAFPHLKDLLPISGGEAGGIVDLITCIALAYAACKFFGSIYQIRDGKSIFWCSIFAFVVLSRHASSQHGILIHTCDLFGFPHPAHHGELFPIVGNARMERGLLTYIFDLIDLKTMSHAV